jgi:hypothetical protein
MASDFSDQLRAAWLESRQFLDPEQKITLTAANGQKALGIATSFVSSKELKAASYADKIPAAIELLREDFARLALADRSDLTVAARTLTITHIGDDPIDPCVQLTVVHLSLQAAAVAAVSDAGSVALSIGQDTVPITFALTARFPDANYVFDYLYVGNKIDANPLAIEVVPGPRTALGFTALLGGAPDTANYILYWKAKTP